MRERESLGTGFSVLVGSDVCCFSHFPGKYLLGLGSWEMAWCCFVVVKKGVEFCGG